MATQTGSIDLEATNAVKLAAEASVDNKLTNYTTHAQLDLSADQIRGEVAETYATKSEAALELSKSGTVVALDEAADARLKALTIHGKSVQDGTPSPSSPVPIQSVEGRNLLDLGEITFTRFKKVELGETFPTGQYVFSADIDTDYTGNSFRVLFYNGNAEAGGWYLTVTNGRISGQVHPTSSFDAIGLYAGYNYSEAGGHTATYTDIQLEIGGTEHRYQPKGEIELRINGKNLFDKDNPNAIAAYVNSAGAMVPSTPDLTAVIPVIGGETYTVSGRKVQLSGTTSDDWACAAFQVRPAAGSQGTVMFYGKNDAAMPQTFTVPSNCSYIALKYANTARVDATATAATIQLEYGSEATAYEPYSSTTTPIPVALRSLPDGTHDEWISGETEDTLIQRVAHVEVNSQSSGIYPNAVTVGGTPMTLFRIQLDANSFPAFFYDGVPSQWNVLSNQYYSNGNNIRFDGWINLNHSVYTTLDVVGAIDVVTTLWSTAADFKAALAGNPLYVDYALETPITTTYPHTDLPYVSDGDSVWVDAQVTPTIDVTYWSENGETVSALSSTLTQTAAGLELELQGKVDSDEEWVSWMHAGTDPTTHEPYLAMGQDSDYPSVVYGGSAAKFYDGEGDAASNVVASFGADGAVVGNVESSHTSITPEVTAFHDANGNEAARISMSDQGAVTAWASYSVNPTTSWTDRTETGITPLPDFTLGDLELTVSVDGEAIHSYSISSLTEPQISVTYGDIDIKFQATKSGETWTAAMSCRNRNMSTQPTVTFGLSWEHIGTAPMWKFGGASDQGAYSFSAGDGNQPTGEGAVTLGLGLTANRQAQVVVGKHNKPYQSARFIVGNGTDDAGRSNALAVTDQGIETVGYIQTDGTVGLGSEAQQGWLTALGINNLFHFKTVNSSAQSVGSGSVVEFTAGIPAVSGMTCRGATQVWTTGTGTTIVGAPWRTSADSLIHSKVRGNVASNVTVYWLLFYTADAFTTTS